MKRSMTVVSAVAAVLAGGAALSAADAETARPAAAASAPSAAAKGGASGPWRLNGGAKWPGRATGDVRVKNAHVRICFNFWGSGTKKGFSIYLVRTGAHGYQKTIWSKKYWGPKNKTCSPWKAKNTGYMQAYMSVRSKAYGDVWIYWY